MQHFNLWLRRPALCLFWLTLNFFTPPAQAQEYLVSVQHYSVPEGLSHRYVRHVVQDGRGFIWAATFDGLNRFDGFEFRQYTKEKDGLSSNSCEYLLEDCRGQIWVVYSRNPGGEGGSAGFYPIDLLDPVTGAIKPFEKAFQVPFQTKDIRGIRADGSGNIYILVKSGQSHEVFRYDGQSLRGLLQAPLDTVGYLALSGGATVNLLDGNRLLQYDSLGGLRHQVALPAHCDFIRVAEGHSWVGRKRPESGPALWPVRDGKVGEPFYFLGRSGQPLNLEWSDDFEIPVYPGGSGRWWVFDNERLLLFGPQGQFVYDFSANLEEHSLSYPAFITFDRRNTAWIGSTQGLLSVSIRKNPFSNYLTSRELKDTRGIAQGKEGQVYFVQNGQAWMLSADANAAVNTGAPAWLAAARDVAGNLWFGDYYFNVHFYDPVSGAQKVIRPSEVAGDARFNSTRALFPDPASGRIWIGTGKGGLAYIDSPEEGIQPFAAYNQFQHLQKAGIWCFLPDGSALWLGTNQGLYRLEREKGITAEYSRRTGSLPFDEIYHIYKDKEGLFWLATKGGGLVRWDRSRGTYRQFTQEEGLSHNVIYAVYEDENEQLWLPSNHGLMRFDKHSFQVNTYLPRDGLPHEEFNFSSHFQAPDGRLYFGGLKGVTAFYPEALYQETDQAGPGLVVSQYLELDGATGAFVDRTTELLAAGRIRLAPKNKSFILKIAFPDYQSPQDNRFAYRVEGLQDSWVYQPDNDIRLNSLPYGSFTLHVKAQGASGRWSARELTLPMTVLRPFYLRWWFIGLCVTLFFLAIAGRMRSLRRRARKLETEVKKRTRQIEEDKEVIEKQAAELRELDEMKSRFFTNVAHELRTPITLIQGPLQLALEKATLDKDTAAMLKLARGNTKNLLRLVEEL
ncbi:MAG: hypothetical protein KDD10_30025, partial [Phaeodactylibacter sp.]|nr:hypothetical protein [Phaeodactylibacter sp.]